MPDHLLWMCFSVLVVATIAQKSRLGGTLRTTVGEPTPVMMVASPKKPTQTRTRKVWLRVTQWWSKRGAAAPLNSAGACSRPRDLPLTQRYSVPDPMMIKPPTRYVVERITPWRSFTASMDLAECINEQARLHPCCRLVSVVFDGSQYVSIWEKP